MLTPSLVPIDHILAPSTGVPTHAAVFRVERAGWFAGRTWSVGELAVAADHAEDGQTVVLSAVGPGRPRFGRVDGLQLRGDRDEPCAASRWVIAGRLLGVVREAGERWIMDWFDHPVVDLVPTPPPANTTRQLGLFAA